MWYKYKPLWWCMVDGLDLVRGTITTFSFLFTSFQYGKFCSLFTSIVSHFPSRLFILNSLIISHPWVLLFFLVYWENIPYRCGIYNFIQISINYIYSAWINNIYSNFFGPYIDKVNYCLIIDLGSFKAFGWFQTTLYTRVLVNVINSWKGTHFLVHISSSIFVLLLDHYTQHPFNCAVSWFLKQLQLWQRNVHRRFVSFFGLVTIQKYISPGRALKLSIFLVYTGFRWVIK